MPFKSRAQRAYLYAKHPEIAKEFEANTPPGRLPERIGSQLEKALKIERRVHKEMK